MIPCAVPLFVIVASNPDSVLGEFGAFGMVGGRMGEEELGVVGDQFVAYGFLGKGVLFVFVDDFEHAV